MGASQSARKITVVNDEASGVIKISDAVVQRLKGGSKICESTSVLRCRANFGRLIMCKVIFLFFKNP